MYISQSPLHLCLEQYILCISKSLSESYTVTVNHSSNESRDSLDNEKLISTLDRTKHIIEQILSDRRLRNDLYAFNFRPVLGHLFHLLLQIFANIKYDHLLRVRSSEILNLLADVRWKDESADFLAIVLPGILLNCKNIIHRNLSTSSLELTQNAFMLIGNSISLAFSEISDKDETTTENCTSSEILNKSGGQNNVKDQSKNKEFFEQFHRTNEWLLMAVAKIVPQLAQIFSRLTTSLDNRKIEYGLFAVKFLYSNCGPKLGDDFIIIACDLCVYHYSQKDERIYEVVNSLLILLQHDNEKLLEYFASNKLKKLFAAAQKKGIESPSTILQNIINMFHIWGSDLLDRLILSSSTFLNDFFNSLFRLIEIKQSKLAISSIYLCNEEENRELTTPKLDSFLPLESNVTFSHLLELSKIFLNSENLKIIVDLLFEHSLGFKQFGEDSNIQIPSSYLLYALAYLIHDSKTISSSESEKGLEECKEHLTSYSNEVLVNLKTLMDTIDESINDEMIESGFSTHTFSSCMTIINLHLLSLIALFSIRKKHNQLVRIRILYRLLECCSSSNILVKETAMYSIECIANNSQQSVSDLLYQHLEYLISSISLACRDFIQNPRSPLVLSEFVSRCNQPDVFFKTKYMIDEFLLSLDRNNQVKTMMLLRAMRHYMQSLFHYFPNLNPPPRIEINQLEENQEPKDENFQLVHCAVNILSRTKHLISSQFIPIQMLIMDILNLSLKIVRNYENELLPMIHQNWHGLVRKMQKFQDNESQKLVAAKAIEVVQTMCELSGMFMHHKIIEEFVPNILSYVQKHDNFGAGKKRSLTADEKLFDAIQKCIPVIAEKCELPCEMKNDLLKIVISAQ